MAVKRVMKKVLAKHIYINIILPCLGVRVMPPSWWSSSCWHEAQGSGGSASETKQKYTLKSEGGGTYKVAGGQTINVSRPTPALPKLHRRMQVFECHNDSSSSCTRKLRNTHHMQVATAGVNAFVRWASLLEAWRLTNFNVI